MAEQRHAIRQLDPLVIGKIAAGEVVERPAFAIKELVENSIDAGATAITVEIRDGGLTFFRVMDNGCGIQPGDIRLAFARHATSKLHKAEDLQAIHTLGFRGEALASIAAVAHVEMTTRAIGHDIGIKAIVDGGVITSIQDAASPEGTNIAVKDLFYNTPARKKFLKKPATETALVSDLVMRLILARPDVAFRLVSNQKTVYHSSGNGNLKDAIFSVLGRESIASLVEVKGSAAGCAVHGFVGVGEAARSSKAMQTFILNGRYVRNKFLSQALDEACHERVMIGKHPVCALHLTMPFESVDVNVHPNKLEVRFQDERSLMEGLSRIIRASFEVNPIQAAQRIQLAEKEEKSAPNGLPALGRIETRAVIPDSLHDSVIANRPAVRVRDAGTAPTFAPNIPSVYPQDVTPPAGTPLLKKPFEAAIDILPASPNTLQQQEALPGLETSATQTPNGHLSLHMVGVAWYEYVFVQGEDSMYIIDQHAAHERVLYEQLMRAMGQQTASQQLLVPQIVELTHKEHTAILENLDVLQDAGFEIEDYGGRSIQVRAVPMVLGVPHIKSFFGEVADRLIESRALPTQEEKRNVLLKFACRKAVKAGDPLSEESIKQLIREMQETGAPPTCPHGRPLVIVIDKTEIDKRFRRIV